MAIDRAKKVEEIDVEEVLAELEHKVERVKILYEQYFMGIEKIEPQTARKEIARKLLDLTQFNIRNTALRYRFFAINQKFGVYQTYWSRTLRQIENGTYFRSIARANREAARRGLEMPDEVLHALPPLLRERIIRDRERLAAHAAKDSAPAAAVAPAPAAPAAGDNFDATFDALWGSMTGTHARPELPPSAPPAPAAAPTPPSAPRAAVPRPLPPGMDEARVRELHRQYLQAQGALGQPANVRYEQILATVIKQGSKIVEEHQAKAVDFAVVMRDGKVILKATPKR